MPDSTLQEILHFLKFRTCSVKEWYASFSSNGLQQKASSCKVCFFKTTAVARKLQEAGNGTTMHIGICINKKLNAMCKNSQVVSSPNKFTFASRVFPVPGAPVKSMPCKTARFTTVQSSDKKTDIQNPQSKVTTKCYSQDGRVITLGSFPPRRVNFEGFLRYSTTSSSSFLASSQPFTSLNVLTFCNSIEGSFEYVFVFCTEKSNYKQTTTMKTVWCERKTLIKFMF